MDDMLDDFDQDKMMKELEKEASKKGKSDDLTLNAEQRDKLQKATHDKQMLADKDGNIFRVEEIDFIIKDVLKHQHKAFKVKREIEELKELVEEQEGFINHLEEKLFVPHDSASLKYTNAELVKSQRSVIFYLAKRIGVNLLTGKSIMNVSLPIKIFEPRSFLEKVAADFRYAPHFLKLAMNTTEAVERFKFITALHIVSLHIEPQMYKPFNPILGETFQGVIGDYEVAIEQISHHPPISAFQLWSNKIENAPIIDGYLAYEASTGFASITGYKKGLIRVKFPDNGQEIIAHDFPEFEMRGLMKGDRTFDFLKGLKVSDDKNKIYADVIFNPDKKGWFKRMFTSSQKTAHDYFEGVISNGKYSTYVRNNQFRLIKMIIFSLPSIFCKSE